MSDIIKAEDYRNTSFYDSIESSDKNELRIRATLAVNLKNKLITQEQFDKANAQLDDLVKGHLVRPDGSINTGKGKGEGSRGGHVIGHTKSGKPIYQNERGDSSKYKNFTPEEHMEAHKHHTNEANNHALSTPTDIPSKVSYHKAMVKHHDTVAGSHVVEAGKKQEKSLSPDEKKIIAEQKKKQIIYHNDMYDFHKNAHKKLSDLKAKHGQAAEGLMPGGSIDSHKERYLDAMRYHSEQKERLEKE